MISKLSIRNFKCLRDVEVDLERFTVFVGPNGSGKSSILRAVDLLCRSFRFDDSVQAEWARSASRGAKVAVEVACESNGQEYRYRSFDGSTQRGPLVPGLDWTGEGPGVRSGPYSADWRRWTPSPDGAVPLPFTVLVRLEASRLAQAEPAADPTAMAPDGTGLHGALANMALNDPDSWQRLQTDLRRIIPRIRRLRHTKATLHQPAALLFDTDGADALEADQVSEGTLLVLGLLAALHDPSHPTLVLMDDLDRGLHPSAQRELITLLRGLLETNPDLQILASTHSPYMLDCMETNEVRMTDLREDGSTACAPLSDHPKFQKWKDEMAPGEMWSLFGEKWLVSPGASR